MKDKTYKLGEVIQKPDLSNRLEVYQIEKRTTQQLDIAEINDLKRKFKRCADKLIHVTKPKSEFEISHENKQIVEGMFWWFFNDPRSCYDLNKGLLLKGSKGTGKTTFIEAFREFFITLEQGFAIGTATKISLEYARTGELTEWLKPQLVAIDEIGCENMGKHYGNELNVIGYILHERYALWKSKGICTIASTNKDAGEIELLYGDVIRDRVKEMFNHIVLDGESRR